MKKAFLHIVLFCSLLLTACNPATDYSTPRQGNAVYYWRTSLMLDTTEQAFLRNNDIKTIYCRYFDVVLDLSGEPQPNATLRFSQDIPDSIEVVPTVFIMNDCMQSSVLNSHGGVGGFAKKIVDRVLQMNETHEIHNVHELQIDCDYTERNRELYYRFLQETGSLLAKQHLTLSATIRLHQLAMPAPPVSYGVLMLYNTGDPQRYLQEASNDSKQSRNPILDLRDVKPYLHYLKDYPLPMGAAYPTFVWNRTIHGVNISHTADYDEMLRTKRLVEAERRDLRSLILTYHLDHENINRYLPKQYEEIYHH